MPEPTLPIDPAELTPDDYAFLDHMDNAGPYDVSESDEVRWAGLLARTSMPPISQSRPSINQVVDHSTSTVSIKHWNCYGAPYPTELTHRATVTDSRAESGQCRVVLASRDDETNAFDVLAEINTSPVDGLLHAPCIHLTATDDLIASVYQIGPQLMLRLELDVSLVPTAIPGVFWIKP